MISYKMARRSFIRGLGGSAALLVPLLRTIESRAAGAAPPLRFLVIHHPLGASPGLSGWRPNASATTTSFTLPSESAPFAPLQSKMVMIDGLNIITASKKSGGNNGGQNTHEGGIVAIMTGVPTLGPIGQQDHAAGGASIDQVLLAQSPLLGGAAVPMDQRTSFGSLQLAADIRSDRDEVGPRVLSYLPPTNNSDVGAARQPMYPETQPVNTFKRIFGGATPTGTDMTALLNRKLSVLDFMSKDLARMKTLIPSSEKIKMDTHADAIKQLETSIRTNLGSATGGTGATCMKPAMPATFNANGAGQSGSKLSGVDYYVSGNSSSHPHIDLGRAQLSLIKAAFTCDLVRVATFMWSAGTNWVVFPGTVNGASIKGNPQSSAHHPPSHSDPTGDAATRDWLNQVNIIYSQQTAAALMEFDAAKESDGTSLLDNMVVPYVTEVARAWDHDQHNVPFIVFGGKNSKLKGGTFVKTTGSLPQQTSATASGGSGNRPFNDMWLTLMPIFGVTMNSLGAASQSTGPITGVVAT